MTARRLMTCRVPRFLGALFLAWTCVLSAGCEEKRTPEWGGIPLEQAVGDRESRSAPRPDHAPLRLLVYNVENYLRMERQVDGVLTPDAPKPEASVAALVRIIAEAKPDVLGICEIGTRADAEDLRQRLAQAGLDLPHLEYTHGVDPVRRLALFSRYPIVERNSVTQGAALVNGRRMSLLRGILDATVERDGRRTRFLGVHFKSRRETPEYDQEQLRRAEAGLLRQHIDSILRDDPTAPLVVYGDFNDTRGTPVMRAVLGTSGSPGYLTAVPLSDGRGQTWTYHWRAEDIYSRIDFILLSPSLTRSVNRGASGILDPADWRDASDHRPLLLQLR